MEEDREKVFLKSPFSVAIIYVTDVNIYNNNNIIIIIHVQLDERVLLCNFDSSFNNNFIVSFISLMLSLLEMYFMTF